jgi:hypothetical protein
MVGIVVIWGFPFIKKLRPAGLGHLKAQQARQPSRLVAATRAPVCRAPEKATEKGVEAVAVQGSRSLHCSF